MSVLITQHRPTGTDPEKLYVVPHGKRLVNSTVLAVNVTTSDATASVYILPNQDRDDATPTQDHASLYAITVSGSSGDVLSKDRWFGVDSGNTVWVESGTASAINFQLFGDV